jgi:hypothetical protein
MATPKITRELLLRYFKTAPPREVDEQLALVLTALRPADQQVLVDAAKAFLLQETNSQLTRESGAVAALSTRHLEEKEPFDLAVSETETLLAEIQSL